MKKILIVEDKKKLRDLLKLIFRLSGYKKLYYASNSEECVKKMKRLNPDITLLDVDATGKMDIVSALSSIRNQPSISSSNVILFSKNKKKELIGEGASDLISGPIKPLELISIVEHMIGKRDVDMPQNRTEEIVTYAPASFTPQAYSQRI